MQEDVAPEFQIVPAPVAEHERASVLDFLRGIALLGILTVNIVIFANPGTGLGLGDSTITPDRLTLFFITWFAQAKFYSLFSFLFGIGFAVQMRNAEHGDENTTIRFIRRSITLAVFGILHIVFLWVGDILLTYAVIGLLLLAFKNVSDKALKWWIGGLIGFPTLLILGVTLLIVLFRLIPAVEAGCVKMETEILDGMLKAENDEIANLQNQTYREAMKSRLIHFLLQIIALATAMPAILAMFLSGLMVGRRKIPMNPMEHLPLIRRMAFWGLLIGVLASGFVAFTILWAPFLTAIPVMFYNNNFAGPVLGLGYAATLTLIYLRTGPSWWNKPIAAAGRMALTNYLTQSVVNTFLFAGFGFGLGGQIGPFGLIGIVIVIYSCQLVISTVWLHFFQFGPMEWLWRAITYWKWPSMLSNTKHTQTI